MPISRILDKENVVHIQSVILLNCKMNEIMPFAATRMDLETIILSEVSQTVKDRHYMISLICQIWKKGSFELILEQKQIQRLYQRGHVGGDGGIDRGFGFSICTLRYMEWLANEDLMYGTENSTQYSVIICVKKESEREWMCVYV